MSGGEVRCPSCGRANLSSASVCYSCGYSFAGGEAAGSGPPASAGRRYHQDPIWRGRRRAHPSLADEWVPQATTGSAHGTPSDGPPRRISRRRPVASALAVGLTLVVVGAGAIAAVYTVNAEPRTEFVQGGNTWSISPTTLTALNAVIHWSGGTNGTFVYVVWGKVDCFVPTGVVATGMGPGGHLSGSLDPGTTYNLYACNGPTPEPMNFTVSLQGGLTITEVAAGFMVGIGVGFVAIGLRGHSVPARKKRLAEPE